MHVSGARGAELCSSGAKAGLGGEVCQCICTFKDQFLDTQRVSPLRLSRLNRGHLHVEETEHNRNWYPYWRGRTLASIGAGVMGQTLLRGYLSGKLVAHDRVWAGDKNPATCDAASEALGIAVESDYRRAAGADLSAVRQAERPPVGCHAAQRADCGRDGC